MTQLANVIERWCFRLSGYSLLAICLIIGWQVFARKVLNDSPSWSEPTALLLLLYAVMLAAAAGCRSQLHLGLAWFRDQFSSAVKARVLQFEFIACGLLGVAMAYFGTAMSLRTLHYILPGLSLPMSLQYLPLVIGGALIALFNLEQLLGSFEPKKEYEL